MVVIYGCVQTENQRRQKNAEKLLEILITMRMQQYDARHIVQWSTSWALLEATVCRHWASACTALPCQGHWFWLQTQKH
jgi:hypothetical protein